MSHRLNFISGVVMLVVAGTSVFFMLERDGSFREPATGRLSDEERIAPMRKKGENIRSVSFERSRKVFHAAGDPETGDGHPEPHSRVLRERKPSLRQDLKVEVTSGHPRRQELEQRARAVESFALRRLAVMTDQLDLTDEQQAKLFPVLVRGSQSYDPGMRIIQGSHASPLPSASEDTSTTAPLDKSQEQELVKEALDPAQEDELIERSIGDLLIWEEIIGDLTRQLDLATPGQIADVEPEPEPERATTGGGTPSDSTITPPATGSDSTAPPDSRGGRNLFDEVTPGN